MLLFNVICKITVAQSITEICRFEKNIVFCPIFKSAFGKLKYKPAAHLERMARVGLGTGTAQWQHPTPTWTQIQRCSQPSTQRTKEWPSSSLPSKMPENQNSQREEKWNLCHQNRLYLYFGRAQKSLRANKRSAIIFSNHKYLRRKGINSNEHKVIVYNKKIKTTEGDTIRLHLLNAHSCPERQLPKREDSLPFQFHLLSTFLSSAAMQWVRVFEGRM